MLSSDFSFVKTKEQNLFLPSSSNQTNLTSPILALQRKWTCHIFPASQTKSDKTPMQYEYTPNYSPPSRSKVILLQRRMTSRTWHSYAYGLHLHCSVSLKSLLKHVVFLRRKSRTAQRSWGFLVRSVRLYGALTNVSCP